MCAPGSRYRVVEDWRAAYPDPIVLASGEVVELTGREDTWDGHRWLWAISPAGRQGWVPDNLVKATASPVVALRDYTAMELTCCRGDVLQAIEETHGWIYGRADTGDCGWVPIRNLTPADPA